MEISAKVIAHSKSAVNGKEIVTFELDYPRFIHGELMTHRMLSRNAMSSRAVPSNKLVGQVRDDPALPIHWGKNQSGMQAKEELTGVMLDAAKYFWLDAAELMSNRAYLMDATGLHKQVANRILEPFQWMKTVVTATEWENFFWLRNHEDAQPEIKLLAEVMLEALSESNPYVLNLGDWHVPYWYNGVWRQGSKNKDGTTAYLDDALAISSSCCAQVSYRLLDDSLEKARMIYKRLVESKPVHASPFEHCATPMEDFISVDQAFATEGITHMSKNGKYWSGNFEGYIQYRQLVPNNVKIG